MTKASLVFCLIQFCHWVMLTVNQGIRGRLLTVSSMSELMNRRLWISMPVIFVFFMPMLFSCRCVSGLYCHDMGPFILQAFLVIPAMIVIS